MRASTHRLVFCSAVALALLLPASLPATAAETIKQAVKDGDVQVDLRYRFERVEQDGFDKNAAASTARLRVGYRTGEYHGIYAGAALQALRVVGSERYNSTANGKTGFPVVADPEDDELYEAVVGYTGLRRTDLKLGRQAIMLDNQRFVGGVDFRQLGQSFDAFSARSDITLRFRLFYAHLQGAKRIFGTHHPVPLLAEFDLNSDLLNLSYKTKFGKLAGYGYFLEFRRTPLASHRNLGLRFSGQLPLSERFKLFYAGEYADQSSYRDGSPNIEAEYYLAEPGLAFENHKFRVGHEVLGGDGVYAFQTPLGTNHKFNGWADLFLRTPLDGLRDSYFRYDIDLEGLSLIVVYHDFKSDRGDRNYGREWDWRLAKTFHKSYTVVLAFAEYDASDFAVDTRRLWATLQFKI